MPARGESLVGQRFGSLVAVELVSLPGKRKRTRYRCTCDCGNESVVTTDNLKTGNTKSCGCNRARSCSARFSTHGHTRGIGTSPTYTSWYQMKARCRSIKHIAYKNYGGRGISVCARWVTSFENFLADMGERPPNTSIDRINNDGNYEPGNCRWATRSQQARNRRKWKKKRNGN